MAKKKGAADAAPFQAEEEKTPCLSGRHCSEIRKGRTFAA
jgi:hypothetical protein